MKILITGGSGFIGAHLIKSLVSKGHLVVNLSRGNKASGNPQVRQVQYDGKSIPDEVGSTDVVINLAGAGLGDKRWSEAYKKTIMQSRVDVTRACTEFIKNAEHKPKVYLSASGYNYYGEDFTEVRDESGPLGTGFLAEVCGAWEKEAEGAGVRTVLLRTSVVLGKDGGPLQKMVTPYKFFVGGPIGSGKQGFPWIHFQDWVNAAIFLIEKENIEGPVNMVSPQQQTQEQFSSILAKVLKRPNFFWAPAFLMKCVFGEMGVLLLGGGFVKPGVLKENGFEYQFPETEGALKDLLG